MSAVGTALAIPFRWFRSSLRRLLSADRIDITCDNINITIDQENG